MRFKKSAKAFTLLELIVVIVILGILAALAIPTFGRVIERTKDQTAGITLSSIARDVQAISAFAPADGFTYANVQAAVSETTGAFAEGTQAASTFVMAPNSDTVTPGGLGSISTRYGEVGWASSANRDTLGLAMRTDSGRCVYVQAQASSSTIWAFSSTKLPSCAAGFARGLTPGDNGGEVVVPPGGGNDVVTPGGGTPGGGDNGGETPAGEDFGIIFGSFSYGFIDSFVDDGESYPAQQYVSWYSNGFQLDNDKGLAGTRLSCDSSYSGTVDTWQNGYTNNYEWSTGSLPEGATPSPVTCTVEILNLDGQVAASATRTLTLEVSNATVDTRPEVGASPVVSSVNVSEADGGTARVQLGQPVRGIDTAYLRLYQNGSLIGGTMLPISDNRSTLTELTFTDLYIEPGSYDAHIDIQYTSADNFSLYKSSDLLSSNTFTLTY